MRPRVSIYGQMECLDSSSSPCYTGGMTLTRRRMIACLLDFVLVLGLGGAFYVTGWAVSAAYWLLRDGLFEGQSLGKRIMGLKVVVDPGGRRCTFRASVLRNFLWVIPVMNILMALSGLYYLLTGRSGRHWGDRLAETRVVKV